MQEIIEDIAITSIYKGMITVSQLIEDSKLLAKFWI